MNKKLQDAFNDPNPSNKFFELLVEKQKMTKDEQSAIEKDDDFLSYKIDEFMKAKNDAEIHDLVQEVYQRGIEHGREKFAKSELAAERQRTIERLRNFRQFIGIKEDELRVMLVTNCLTQIYPDATDEEIYGK